MQDSHVWLCLKVLKYKYLNTVHCTLMACGLFLPSGQEVHQGQHLPDKSTCIRSNKSLVLMNATEQCYTGFRWGTGGVQVFFSIYSCSPRTVPRCDYSTGILTGVPACCIKYTAGSPGSPFAPGNPCSINYS